MQVAKSALVGLLKALHVDSVDGWDTAKITARVNQDKGISRYSDTPEPFAPGTPMQALFTEIVADQTAGNLVEVMEDEPPVPVPVVTNGKPPKKAPTKPAGTKPKVKPPASKSGKPQKTVAKKPIAGKGGKAKPKANIAAKKVPPKSGKTHVKKVPKSGKGYHRYEGFAKFPDWIAHLKKNPKKLPTEGVLFATVRELKNAGKTNKPVTKEHILRVLAEEFPDRTIPKLETTLNNNVPGRLLWMFGVHVWRQKASGKKTGYYIVGKGDKPQSKTDVMAIPAKPAPKPKANPKKKPQKIKA